VLRRKLLLAPGALLAAPSQKATILFEDRKIELSQSRVEKNDLWIPAGELPRINEFVVKPQGACRSDVCIPLGAELKKRGWLNLSGFTRKVKQVIVREGELWSLSEMPLLRTGFLQSRIAPNFSVKDRKGQSVQLSDFRGKKVLLLSWASW
jgi:hypothetical protein